MNRPAFPSRRDPLTVVIGTLLVLTAAVALGIAIIIWPGPTGFHSAPPGYIAFAGEWTVNPDGSRVCQLRRDIRKNEAAGSPREWCGDWQEPPPTPPTPINQRWARIQGGSVQILVGGKWR